MAAPSTPEPYEQRHAAVTAFLRIACAVGAALLVAAVLTVSLDPDALGLGVAMLLALVGLVVTIAGAQRVVRVYPAGFRIDAAGVTIGRIDGRARDVVTPISRAQGAFHAPWQAIRRVEVVTDGVQLESLQRMGRVAFEKAPRERVVPLTYVDFNPGGPGVGAGQFWQAFSTSYLVVVLVAGPGSTPSSPRFARVRRQGVLDFGVWFIPVREPRVVRSVLAGWHAAGRAAANGTHRTVGPVDPPAARA